MLYGIAIYVLVQAKDEGKDQQKLVEEIHAKEIDTAHAVTISISSSYSDDDDV